eukprot:1160798-Pelagomonas_calceolata.AAC.2
MSLQKEWSENEPMVGQIQSSNHLPWRKLEIQHEGMLAQYMRVTNPKLGGDNGPRMGLWTLLG